jgi:hypothetical protein
LALAAVTALFLATHSQTEAGAANSLAIEPASKEIGVGSSGSVQLVSNPPEESLAAWVIEIAYDPTVVSLDSCQSIANPPGAVAASACEAKDTGGSPDYDTVVSVGGVLFPDTERGLDGEQVLATMNFDAVGAIGACTDLTISVTSHLGPDPEGEDTDPAVTNGEICIVESAGEDRIWGDVDCNGTANPVDSLKLLRFDAGLSVDQAAGCPAVNAAVTVDGAALAWGNVDCDSGAPGPVDSLKLLRFDGGLEVAQEPGCPEIGSTVSVEV